MKMNKSKILIDFAKGDQITDQRSIVFTVGRAADGKLITANESYACALATNGRKTIILKMPDVGVLSEDEKQRLIAGVHKKLARSDAAGS
jgi:hypothetical protein